MLRRLNLDGDTQADLTVHGGPDKALYAYPEEHYDYWKRRLPNMKLPLGYVRREPYDGRITRRPS